jgi:hypothetical protein
LGPGANTQIRPLAAHTGLDVVHRTEIKLPTPCALVEATLVTLAQPAEMEAINSDGTQAGVDVMTGAHNVPETLSVPGTSIESVVITAKAGETLLLRFCFEPLST